MKSLTETNTVPIRDAYDVIVVGGGVAGVSAALAARRNGCRVLLIEKSVMLGGLATLGLVTIYLPLCDGRGHKVIGGFAEELLYLSIRYGYDTLPEEWRGGPPSVDIFCERTLRSACCEALRVRRSRSQLALRSERRYMTAFSAPAFVLALDELIEAEGVDLAFDTVFCKPVVEGNTCTALIVENKSGRCAYQARVVVDATGDCDVMARAGAPCADGENLLSYWAEAIDPPSMARAIAAGSVRQALIGGRWGAGIGRSGEVFGYRPVDEAEGAPRYNGVSAETVTRFILDGRRLARASLQSGEGARTLVALPGMAQFRTTRRIVGCYELTASDVFRRFEDSIGCIGDWIRPGPILEIPYRALISPALKNVITAGRSIASAGDAWHATRVIPPAAMTGQAAGTAAALAVAGSGDLHGISVAELQTRLAETGVIIHSPRTG